MYGGDAGSCALHCPTSPGAAQWTRPPPTLPTCVSAVRLSSDESTFCYPASRGLAAPGARRATSPRLYTGRPCNVSSVYQCCQF